MIPTSPATLILHCNGQRLPATADHPFFVPGRGWVRAADLRVGDRLRWHDGQDVPLEAITPGPQAVVDSPARPLAHFPLSGLVAGTLIETADGPKRIEDIQPGDWLL